MAATRITSPDDPALDQLCAKLAERATELDRTAYWPAEQLRLCGQYGVYEWFLDPAWGGQGWSTEQTTRGYLALATACLTTSFILTQRTGACRRIEGSSNASLKEQLLPPLASGDSFATVGISHLTTSRRHLAKPVLTAESVPGGFRLDGFAPWVTGAASADVVVIAATLIEHDHVTDRQLLMALPTDLPGVTVDAPLPLVGVTAASTGPVRLERVEVDERWLIAGPTPNVMQSGLGGNTGGHETSALAIGLAAAAIKYLKAEAANRADLRPPLGALQLELQSVEGDLWALVRDEPVCSKEVLRQRANSLTLRAAQAALAAAKGTGYVVGHPAGRWCREALFFLVWSCPQPVAAANLCELAGIVE